LTIPSFVLFTCVVAHSKFIDKLIVAPYMKDIGIMEVNDDYNLKISKKLNKK
jgi:hypothetical protein